MTFSILVDQNVPPQVCNFLRTRKPLWQVWHVSEVGLRGASDETIFQWAQKRGAVVITFDEDFADARMYPAGSHAGVIRLRVWPTTVENTEEGLARLFEIVTEDDLRGSLVIVDQRRIRIRRSAQHG